MRAIDWDHNTSQNPNYTHGARRVFCTRSWWYCFERWKVLKLKHIMHCCCWRKSIHTIHVIRTTGDVPIRYRCTISVRVLLGFGGIRCSVVLAPNQQRHQQATRSASAHRVHVLIFNSEWLAYAHHAVGRVQWRQWILFTINPLVCITIHKNTTMLLLSPGI